MSSGRPTRPTGMVRPRRASSAPTSRSGSSLRIARLVPTAPGQMALTVIPQAATSSAIERVSAITPALEAAYAPERGTATTPAMDEMLMMRPERWPRMTGTANRDIRNVPRRFTRTTSSHTSTGTSAMSPRSRPCGAAALLTRMSSRPCRAAASLTIRCASRASPMSPSTADAIPPSAMISSTRLSTPRQPSAPLTPTFSCRRLSTPAGCLSLTTTAAPDLASVREIARPMPSRLPQPVTRATRAAVTGVARSRPSSSFPPGPGARPRLDADRGARPEPEDAHDHGDRRVPGPGHDDRHVLARRQDPGEPVPARLPVPLHGRGVRREPDVVLADPVLAGPPQLGAGPAAALDQPVPDPGLGEARGGQQLRVLGAEDHPARRVPEDQRAGARDRVGEVPEQLLRVLGMAVVHELAGAQQRRRHRAGPGRLPALGRERLPRALLLVLRDADGPAAGQALG